jgi:arylsulfatase A-like enzyme/Tfp pilus assembly protein PilF
VPAGVLLVLVSAAALAGWAWWSNNAPPDSPGADVGSLPPGVSRSDLNVVLLTLDTTRADRLGAYGYAEIETPHLDRLAGEGVLFEQAVTVAPLTLPAHSSMLTGRFPPEHGVRDNGGFFLDEAELTLAEVLQARGYRTGAFVAAYVLDGKWGLNQGFDLYYDDFDAGELRSRSLDGLQRRGDKVVDSALAWLEVGDGRPFFAWLHFFDAHTPYDPPEPWRSRYPDRPYDGEIAFMDHQIGRLLAWLDQRELMDRTIVVAIGDHGESLGDHGETTHGFFVYDSVMRVPFIVRAPFSRTGGHRVRDVVRAVDVMPTILDLLGAPVPPQVSGTTLAPRLARQTPEPGLEAYGEARYPLHHFGWSDLRLLREGRYKLIAAPRPELYDLEQDPREMANLFHDRRPLADRMMARLLDLEEAFARDGRDTAAPADVDPEVRGRLAALGYVGSFMATPAADRDGLADPKDKIGLFNLMVEARERSKEGASLPEVLGMLRKVVDEDSNVIDAWFTMGNEYFRAGRMRDAVEHFRRALALKPDYDLAVINMANAYRALGDEEAALVGYEHYLTIDPRNAYVHYQIGEIRMDRGELPAADASFRQALEIDPKLAAARNALGVLRLRQGDPTAAEREIRAALAQKSDVRLAHFNLGVIAEERGDLRAAAAFYRREIDLHPTSYKAAFNLGRIYGRLGDRAAQADAYRLAIRGNPHFAEGHLFLARLLLETRQDLDEAVRLARAGIELDPESEFAPLGHYILADIYNRQGRAAEAAREAARGRALEARSRRGAS